MTLFWCRGENDFAVLRRCLCEGYLFGDGFYRGDFSFAMTQRLSSGRQAGRQFWQYGWMLLLVQCEDVRVRVKMYGMGPSSTCALVVAALPTLSLQVSLHGSVSCIHSFFYPLLAPHQAWSPSSVFPGGGDSPRNQFALGNVLTLGGLAISKLCARHRQFFDQLHQSRCTPRTFFFSRASHKSVLASHLDFDVHSSVWGRTADRIHNKVGIIKTSGSCCRGLLHVTFGRGSKDRWHRGQNFPVRGSCEAGGEGTYRSL